MWKPQKRCNICALIQSGDTELQKRIYASKYFHLTTGETLAAIQESYGGQFLYASLLRHVKKHQTVNDVDRVRKSADRIAIRQEKEITNFQKTNKPNDPDQVWNNIIEQGLKELEEGNIKLTANHLLKAAADKSTAQLKRKDQDIKLSEMIWHFASGESNESKQYDRKIIEGETPTAYNPAAITARSVDTQQTRASDVYQSSTGNATALRASEVFDASS